MEMPVPHLEDCDESSQHLVHVNFPETLGTMTTSEQMAPRGRPKVPGTC